MGDLLGGLPFNIGQPVAAASAEQRTPPSNSTTALQFAMAGAGGAGGTRPRLNSSACHSRPSLSSHLSRRIPLAKWMSQHCRKSQLLWDAVVG